MQVKNRSIDFVIGTTGCGKSYFMVYTLIPVIPKDNTVILVDLLNEYGGAECKYKLPKFIITDSLKHLITLCQKLNAPKIIYKIKDKKEFKSVCQVALSLEKVCLIIDEIASYPDRDNEYLDDLIRCGRHKDQSLILITQCPVDIPPAYRQNITHIYFFQMLEFRYLMFAKSIIGNSADNLIKLKQGQYMIFPDCVK